MFPSLSSDGSANEALENVVAAVAAAVVVVAAAAVDAPVVAVGEQLAVAATLTGGGECGGAVAAVGGGDGVGDVLVAYGGDLLVEGENVAAVDLNVVVIVAAPLGLLHLHCLFVDQSPKPASGLLLTDRVNSPPRVQQCLANLMPEDLDYLLAPVAGLRL